MVMILKDLLDKRQTVEREILIGRELQINEEPALLLALQEVEETCRDQEKDSDWREKSTKLLVLYDYDEDDDQWLAEEEDWGAQDEWAEDEDDEDWEEEDEDDQRTNRQRLIEEAEENIDSTDIAAFIINGEKYPVQHVRRIDEMDNQPRRAMTLMEEMEAAGSIPQAWLDKQIDGLMLVEYQISSELFGVNWQADILSIEVELNPAAILVGKVIKSSYGRYDVPQEFTIRGRWGREIPVKLHGVYGLDIWDNIDFFRSLTGDTEEEIEEFCSRDQKALVAECSVPREMAMNIYAKDYLDAPAYPDDFFLSEEIDVSAFDYGDLQELGLPDAMIEDEAYAYHFIRFVGVAAKGFKKDVELELISCEEWED